MEFNTEARLRAAFERVFFSIGQNSLMPNLKRLSDKHFDMLVSFKFNMTLLAI